MHKLSAKKYNIKLKDVLVALSFIDLPTIATAIVGRVIALWGAIQKRSNEPMYKTKNKNKAKILWATTIAKLKEW